MTSEQEIQKLKEDNRAFAENVFRSLNKLKMIYRRQGRLSQEFVSQELIRVKTDLQDLYNKSTSDNARNSAQEVEQ